jgi:anthranilate synthase component 1
MTALGSAQAFRAAYEAGKGALVWRESPADLETPVAVFLKIAHGKPYSFLLESVEGGASRGRYSVIGMAPDLVWRCEKGEAAINRTALAAPEAFVHDQRPALESLRALVAETVMDLPNGMPPMAGGLFGYLGYDMVRLMERLPDKTVDVLGLPEAILMRPTVFVIFDNVRDVMTFAAPAFPSAGVSAEQAFADAEARLDRVEQGLLQPVPLPTAPVGAVTLGEPQSNMTRAYFEEMVDKMKDYIAAGDAFQVVPSQRLSLAFPLPPFALYRALRRINPAPFLFFLDFGTFSVAGSSPEILVRLRDGMVTIRPLAGTRPRSPDPVEDLRLEQELLSDPKELAEHLMLLDLGRNDVGRVSELGSVKVVESFVIERFSHVMHISSMVQGKIRPDLDALDALMAGFPAGTLSGAPKVRAMQIIEELEPVRRGIYGGCIGYFAPDGTMDTCIGLRTAVIKDGVMHVQAGGGVVADSVPALEYEESRHKARALFRAAEEAVRFATLPKRAG